MAVSTYYHATLYAFTDAASSKVAMQFAGAMRSDTSIACHYDRTLDMFCVTCQTVQGANADATLSQIIRDYIEKELDSAEREQREPDIIRFPQSKFDALDSLCEEDIEIPSRHSTETTALRGDPTPRTHIVITLEGQGKLARLFPLHELQPFGLLERYIAPKTSRSQKVFEQGLVVRATQWNSTDGYVFNGRREGPRLIASSSQGSDLYLPPFTTLHDARPGSNFEPVEETPLRQWDFVEGHENISVQQWVRGTGQTRQIDPDTKPDVPKDTKLMIAAEQSRTTGRARVPKGKKVLDSDDEDSEDAASSSDESDNVTFAALVGGQGRSEDDSDDNDSDGEPASSFQSLLPSTKETANTAALVKKPEETSMLEIAERRQEVGPPSAEQWRADDRKYAKVDKIGLTANATNVAQWQHENHQDYWSRKTKARANRVVARPSATTSVAALPHFPPRAIAGADVSFEAASLASESGPAASKGHITQGHRPIAKWANPARVVPSGNLLDISSPASAVSPLMPPGLAQGIHLHLRQREVSSTLSATSELGSLIDIRENHPAQTIKSLVPPPKHSEQAAVLKPKPVRTVVPAKPGMGSDDLPVETLEPMPEDWAMTKSTMRQKAGRNANGKGKGKRQPQSKNNFNVQLELPEPVPAPKPKAKHAESSKGQVPQKRGSGQPDEAQTVPWLKASTRLSKDNHAFGKALNREILKQQNLEDDDVETTPVKLHCNIGVLLLRPDESAKSVNHGASDPIELQTKLREHNYQIRTDFLQRITASEEDARYIIAIGTELGGDFIASSSLAWYELLIRDSARVQLRVSIPADRTNGPPRIQGPDVVLGEAFCHFPVSVWDAKFTLQRDGHAHESLSKQAVEDFVSSMETDQQAPSFRAMVSKGLFSVERVQAKRSCTRQFRDWTLTVTEVEDLVTESLLLEHYNFRALSLARDEMLLEQRYYWEVSWDSYDLSKADDLQARVARMIGHLDCVGLENQGPWVLHEGYRSDDNDTEVPDPPFW